MRFPQHASSGSPGLGRSFIPSLAFASALIVLVTAVPLEEDTLLPSRLVARDDPPTSVTAATAIAATATAPPQPPPPSVANPECNNRTTYAFSDTQSLAQQLSTAGPSQICITPPGECVYLKTANSVMAVLCGFEIHSKQCTDYTILGPAMNALSIDCLDNYQVGGKVAISHLDGVTLQLRPNPADQR